MAVGLFFVPSPAMTVENEATVRPNILWLTAEDIGPHLGCYGDEYATSPNIDALAARGMRYEKAWSNAPVCAPARTAIIAGVHPPSLGAEHMRSHVAIPEEIRLFPELLREAGYYCTNNHKEDYNVIPNNAVWDESSGRAHWRNRPGDQPFFAVFNFTSSHESRLRTRPHILRRDKNEAPVPPYHPDTPEVRHDWAQYYDTIEAMDGEVGERLAELEAAGLHEDTIVFFYGDHGSGMPRHKRWCYNSGLHVPLIVHVPEKFRHLAPEDYAPGGASARLVSFVDLAPTVLSLAGRKAPDWMQGRAWMGPHAGEAHDHLFGFRGRMDERIDLVRSVTDGRHVLIRNYMPHLIYGQYLAYMWQTPTTRVWEEQYLAGRLEAPQTFFWEPKPAVELYDLQKDPHEVVNLADDPAYREQRDALARVLREHVLATRDTGFLPEAEAHRRADGDTLYALGHDPDRYPLEEILDAAERAAARDGERIPQLIEDARHRDPAIRYWAAIGVLVRGQEAFDAMGETIAALLDDGSPAVRIAAAEAAGRFGDGPLQEKALETLLDLASPEVNGAYAAIAAINAIDSIGEGAESLRPQLARIPVADPQAPDRVNGYVIRLVPAAD